MRLYLVQHGEAVAKEVHPDRPLTDGGRDDVRLVGALLAGAGVRVSRMIDSGKARARQTAEILASVLAPGITIEDASRGLSPKDSTDWLTKAVGRWTEDSMVVGHQPFLGRMVARLATGSEGADIVAFRPGSVVCLEQAEEGGGWTIAWMVRPELVGRRAPPSP